MLVLLLTACGDVDDAEARAEAFLDAHPRGTAIVHAPVGGEGVEAVVGATGDAAELAARLAPCGEVPAFDATLLLRPGTFPWEVRDAGEAGACVRDRLAGFPFDGPSRRGDAVLVRVRWRPGEEAEALAVDVSEGGLDAGLLERAPPYWRRAPRGDALVEGEDLLVEDGRVRLRPTGRLVTAGALEDADAWARQLTCPADTLDLVRVTLVFEEGHLETVETAPRNGCVEDRAREGDAWLRARTVDGTTLARAGNVLVVLDVPVGAW